MARPETGAMKFGDDWRGVFIRGDHAIHFWLNLNNILQYEAVTLDPLPIRFFPTWT
jgi:hypothetical protein